VGVRRHVGLGLEDLAGRQGEGGAEEGVAPPRRVRDRRPERAAVHHAGVLRSAAVDEAQLADLLGKEALEVDEASLAPAGSASAASTARSPGWR
jgi:hypothetical protein